MANLIDIIDDAIRDETEETTVDLDNDFGLISKASGTVPRKVLLKNWVGTALAAIRSAFTPASASSAASLKLAEDTDNGAHYVEIAAPASLAASRAWVFPDEDGTFASRAYADALVAGLLDLKGSTDCSANPNYPAASKGDAYIASVAGKIGGASGKTVEVGDMYIASADNAGGTEASVGTSWFVIQANLVGAMIGSNNLSEITNAGTARTNLGLGTIAVLAAPSGTVVGTSDTQTLTAKRITARVVTEASNATPTPNADTTDEHTITAQAAAAAFAAPSGTPTEGQPMIIRIKDNGTARALSFNAIYRAIGVTLPTTTVLSKTLYIGMIYNSTDTKWDVLGVAQEA